MLFAFALAYLILAFLTFTFITANVKYLSFISYVVAVWGFIIILFSLFDKSKWKLNLKTIIVILLLISFIVSALFTCSYGISENLKGLIWLTLELIALFLLDKGEIDSKYLKYFLITFVFISTLYSVISISMGIVGYMHYPTSTLGDTVPGGMAHGRLYGMYSDPNYGAITSVLCILSLGFLLYKNKSKFNYVIVATITIIQIIYISLSGSRSGLIELVLSIFITLLLWLKINKKKNIILSTFAALLVSAISLFACLIIEPAYEVIEPQILKTIYGPEINPIHAYTVQFADKVREECGLVSPYLQDNGTDTAENLEQDIYKHGEVNSEHVGVLGRTENEDISNNRFDIWKASIELFLQSPIIGLSNRNYSAYCIDNLPENYLTQVQWTSLHNAFLDVLISQGIIGFILWLAILFILFANLINEINNNKTDSRLIVLFGIFISLMVMCMFYSELIYINTIGSVYFWYTFSHVKNKFNK